MPTILWKDYWKPFHFPIVYLWSWIFFIYFIQNNISQQIKWRNKYKNPSSIKQDIKEFTRLGASLVVQWLRIRLPMQGTRVRALVREDPTCHGGTKSMRHNYWACALEPASHNYWARVPQLLKPDPRARALQQEKPWQWEACTPQRRVAPACHN